MVKGQMKLEFTCPACNKVVVEEVRAHRPDISIRMPESPLGSKQFVWEGQCPHCYHWLDVEA